MGIELGERRGCTAEQEMDGTKSKEGHEVLRGIWRGREGLTGGRIAQSRCPERREIGFGDDESLPLLNQLPSNVNHLLSTSVFSLMLEEGDRTKQKEER